MKLNKLFIVAISLITSLLYGASFDCDKASSKVEHLICGDDELSILDEHLSIAYRDAKKYKEYKQLKLEQRKWMKRRNSCITIYCLKQSYTNRLKILEGYAKGAESKAWSGKFHASTDSLTIQPSLAFEYRSLGDRGDTCELHGKFKEVGDKLEFHDDVNDCHIKISSLENNMLYLEATGCSHYCGTYAMVGSSKFEQVKK